MNALIAAARHVWSRSKLFLLLCEGAFFGALATYPTPIDGINALLNARTSGVAIAVAVIWAVAILREPIERVAEAYFDFTEPAEWRTRGQRLAILLSRDGVIAVVFLTLFISLVGFL